MDIVVCIPKSEYENDSKEDEVYVEGQSYQFWKLGRKPTNLKVGDRMFFIKDKKITHSMNVFMINSGKEKCDVTGREWSGGVLVYLNDLQELNPPIDLGSEFKSFRGFRYKWW